MRVCNSATFVLLQFEWYNKTPEVPSLIWYLQGRPTLYIRKKWRKKKKSTQFHERKLLYGKQNVHPCPNVLDHLLRFPFSEPN